MPRSESRIKCSRWDHDEWLALPIDAQWLYDTICSQVTTNHAGVGTIPRRMWSNLTADEDAADRIGAALKVLIDRRFVAIDDDTDEVLVRSYIRHDVLSGPPGMFVAAMGCARATRSRHLREVLHTELSRFDLAAIEQRKQGKASERPIDALRRALAELDPNPAPPGDKIPTEPRTRPKRPDQPVDEHAMRYGISDGMAHATGALAGAGASRFVATSVESAPPPRRPSTPQQTADPLPGLLLGLPSPPPEPRGCRTHDKLPPDRRPRCPGCQREREKWEADIATRRTAEADARRAAAAACAAPDCEGGWIEHPPDDVHEREWLVRCVCNPAPGVTLRAV